ncbi:hypothetical protein AAWM_11207 [Aspergillus awamori]|uniref:Uncharacterized protein n=1 Tax=Aspergillus awamori TaxID=105351 RepID=A0A401LA17_ASPAW|nr:hypothetical protein AAWM_11207 [Aspergillus awamori]
MHRHLGPLTGVTGGWAEEWKGTQEWVLAPRAAECGLRKRAQRASRRSSLLDHRTLRAGPWAREGRWYYVEGERQLISAAGSPPTLLPCQAGHLSVTGGAQVLRGLASGTGVPAHPGPLLAESETRRLNHARGCPLLPGCLKSGGRSRSPAPMESVDRWPLASLLLQIPGGAAPREPPFVGVSAGSGPSTRGPYAAACQRLQGRFLAGVYLRADRFLGATVGAIGWSSVYSRCAGGVAVAGHFVCPFQSEAYVTRCLFGGFGVNLRKDHYRVRVLWAQPPIRVYCTLLLRRARRLSAAGGAPLPPGPVPAGDPNTNTV